MPVVPLRPLESVATWRLENRHLALDVERDSGLIRSLIFKPSGLDLFAQTRGGIPGYAGALRIYDEHDRRWYGDLETPFTLSGASKRGRTIRYTRRYRGCPFTVEVTLRLDSDFLHWQVQARKNPGPRVADRSLRVYFSMPLIAGWDIWAPNAFGAVTFDGMTPFEFTYTQIPYVSRQEVILPMCSHYHPGRNVGYSILEPIDENVPAAKFAFGNVEKCFTWGSMHKDVRSVPVLEAVNYYIGLVGDRPMKTKVMLCVHAGDWRPGVGAVYRRYREFFDPWNDAIYDREGVFMCGSVHQAQEVDTLRAMGVKTLEVHGHFQDYCDYFQAGKDRWLTIGAKEALRRALMAQHRQDGSARASVDPRQADPWPARIEEYLATHSDAELGALTGIAPDRLYLTRRYVEDCLAKLQAGGISPHWYFNYTDGYRPRVEKDWPDSICRDEEGFPIPSGWYMSHNMNADPRWSFGRFCFESARRIFQAYPWLEGLFLDCFRHFEIDFAHDDGVTVVNGRAAYSVNHSYDDIERLLKTRLMARRNLTSFANKPQTIRSMRYVDGQLLEGDGDQAEEKFFWASIAKPMFYMWTRTEMSLDECLRRAVLHGCFPREAARTDENIARYRRYLPLYEAFRRRVLCFEPDPIRVPHGSRGKLFTVADGYVASVVNTHIDEGDTVVWGKTPWLLLRVARAADVRRVGVMYPGDGRFRMLRRAGRGGKGRRDGCFHFDGTFLGVPLAGYTNCAAVKLFVGPPSGRKIGLDTFAARPRMCGDPESAFEDVSDR